MRVTSRPALLAFMATAVIAFAVPAVASATTWTVAELQKPASTSYSGSIHFQVSEVVSGGVTCDVHAETTLNPTNTGVVDQLEVNFCETTGEMAVCEPQSANKSTATSGEASDFDVEDGAVGLSGLYLGAAFENCPQTHLLFLAGGDLMYPSQGSVTLTPDESEAISTLTASGTGEIETGEGAYEAQVSGTLKADQQEKYGIVAGHWISNEGEALQKSASVGLQGSLQWRISTIGMECTSVQGSLVLLPEGKAEMGELEVDPKSCKGLTWVYRDCRVLGDAVWAGNEGIVQPTSAGKVHSDSFYFNMVMDRWNTPCPWEYTQIEDEVTLSPDNSKAISSLSINEEVSMLTPNGNLSGELSGSFQVTPAGKYGIG